MLRWCVLLGIGLVRSWQYLWGLLFIKRAVMPDRDKIAEGQEEREKRRLQDFEAERERHRSEIRNFRPDGADPYPMFSHGGGTSSSKLPPFNEFGLFGNHARHPIAPPGVLDERTICHKIDEKIRATCAKIIQSGRILNNARRKDPPADVQMVR